MNLKVLLLVLLFSLVSFNSYANVSRPGYWDVGAARELIAISQKDTRYKNSIQMKKELIKVLLYKGFAVVKGEYIMYNHSKNDINVEVGYPENGLFVNKKLSMISFNYLDNLRVRVNDQEIKTKKLDNRNISLDTNSWYVWNNNFPAQKETKITVYYLLDNSSAKIRLGYSTGEGDAFAYIIESGQIWKDKIEHGLIYIKLEDDLSQDDLIGVMPSDTLKYNDEKKIITYQFSNLEPNETNNIVIRYKDQLKDFDFKQTKAKEKYYYDLIDKISIDEKNSNKEPYNFSDKTPVYNDSDSTILSMKDFSVSSTLEYLFYGFLGVLFLLLLAFLKLIFMVIKFFIRKFKKPRI